MATKKGGKRKISSAKKTPAKKTPAKANKAKAPTRASKLAAALAARKGSAILLGANADDLWGRPSYYLDTRSLALNRAIGIPGWPAGRTVEIYGAESSGKSTLVDSAIAECQAQDGLAVLIDTEHVRDFKYMSALGVDQDKLVVEQVETIEQSFDALKHWAEQGREIVGPGKPVILVLDSVAGTPTDEENKKETASDKTRASAAKSMKQGMRGLAQIIARNQIVFLATNQCYASMSQFGGKKTYGGDALPYFASLRVDLFPLGVRVMPRGVAADAKGVPPAGSVVSVTIEKNKCAPPLHRRRMFICYGYGVDNGYSLWHDLGGGKDVKLGDEGAITQSGTWYGINPRLGNYPKWQGGHWGLNELIAELGDDDPLWEKLLKEYGVPS